MLNYLLSLLGAAFLLGVPTHASDLVDESYIRQIHPIFESRCVACHSCSNAPCQLNLQSFEGFDRGANKELVYNGARISSIKPSRMWIDAHSTEEWRKKGFYSINQSKDMKQNLFMNLIKQRMDAPKVKVENQVADSYNCPVGGEELKNLGALQKQLGMPYGFPPLNEQEQKVIETWLVRGAPAPPAYMLIRNSKDHKALAKEIRDWEAFFNHKDRQHRLVSRYIYEHLFLGHLYFKQKPDVFFRMVRSKTQCDAGIQEIGTRRPNDNPQVSDFYYCLRQFTDTVVAKTHIPFELGAEKLNRYKKIFWEEKWIMGKLPGYESGVAENPFVAFKDLPAKARYQFLLDDSQFFVNTFIRGPVCNGSMAVNSIQEQFYVFFLSPKADNTVISREYEAKSRHLLMLPGVWGSEVTISQTPAFVSKLVKHREAYRQFRAEGKQKTRPRGYSLDDIWDGDGNNPNAVLTVFRHNDNAAVLQGAVGDIPKTAFVLDYPLFERLVYNLVTNFDVYGNVGHQLLTRQYMDFIRMEAEELFLSFLPSQDRDKYRREWYRGFFAEAKIEYMFPIVGLSVPSAINFFPNVSTKKQMIEKILFEHLSEEARGPLDAINWKELSTPATFKADLHLDSVQNQMRAITAIKAGAKTPFARYFPDVALVRVIQSGNNMRVFTIIHNREHENIAWILGESLRLAPQEDSLVVREGYWGAYPNIIFEVKEVELKTFIDKIADIDSASDYKKLKKGYAISRYSPDFWKSYDLLTHNYKTTWPIEFGYLDLTRYDLD